MTETEKAVAEIESFIRCVDGNEMALSQTREEYRVAACGAIEYPMVARVGSNAIPMSPEEVIRHAFVQVVRKYAEEVRVAAGLQDLSGLTLYWRLRPEMDVDRKGLVQDVSFEKDRPAPVYEERPFTAFYARLLISAKPVVCDSDGNLLSPEPVWPEKFD